jgi:hypothetical protein
VKNLLREGEEVRGMKVIDDELKEHILEMLKMPTLVSVWAGDKSKLEGF